MKKLKDFIRGIRYNAVRIALPLLRNIDCTGRKILVVAPHPDDEILGCGGLIAKLCEKGAQIHVAIMTRGGASHHGCCDIDIQVLENERIKLTNKVSRRLGLNEDNLHILDYKDGAVPGKEQNGRLAKLINKLEPDTIFTPHPADDWPDHVNTTKLILSSGYTGEIYEYCVWAWYFAMWAGKYKTSALDWKNARVNRLNKSIYKKKIECINIYLDSLAPCGKPYSGVLPTLLTNACNQRCELYFKVNYQSHELEI